MFKKILVGVLSFVSSLFTLRSAGGTATTTTGHPVYTDGDPWDALRADASEIIAKLMDRAIPGTDKFKSALKTLEAIAIQRGVEAVDWALTELIEKEVTTAKGDAIEQVLDEGLETARQVVISTDVKAIAFGNEDARDAAIAALKDKLIADGKSWLLAEHTLRLLIAAAVAKLMTPTPGAVN